MYEQIKKPKENKTRAITNSIYQKKRKKMNSFSFADKKHETITQRKIERIKNNSGLPNNLKSGIENLSGLAMDDVKVHYNSTKPKQLQAHAYTQGTNIYVAPGQEKHLPHEAWHVTQQKMGRVKPTMQMNGASINDSPILESEADKMGSKALKFK